MYFSQMYNVGELKFFSYFGSIVTYEEQKQRKKEENIALVNCHNHMLSKPGALKQANGSSSSAKLVISYS